MIHDVLIIGGGVVGCATLYQLSKYNLKTALVEKENDLACGSTKANSALIHAGFDPDTNTLMAKYNVAGNALAYEICENLDVPIEKIGSLVLAFSIEELETLKKLYANGQKNQVPDLRILSKEETLELESGVSKDIFGALYAPTCGIVSPWEYTYAMAETAVVNDCNVYLNEEVKGITKTSDGFVVTTSTMEIKTKYIVNASGLYGDTVYKLAGGEGIEITAFKGEYFLLDKSQGELVSHVIFQCPTKEGKGIVVSPTVHGNLFAGPDFAQTFGKEDTSTQAKSLELIKQKALKSVPSINFGENIRNFAGLRAVGGTDFIVGESSIQGLYNAIGMKSPGLTSAAAVGLDLANQITEKLQSSKKQHHTNKRKVVRINELTTEEKAEQIAKDKGYGHVICRCQTITAGEIRDILNRPIVPKSLDGIKRRCSAGMGRCQGGFCEPRIHELMAKTLKISMEEVLQDKQGTYIVTGSTKGNL